LELTHSFTVPASVEETWRAFNDIEDVAGCFPGATVTSVEGDDFKGTCKVKIGPISLTYTGAGTFIERDEAARKFVLEAKGKDKRGNGTAGATVTATMTPEAEESTSVEVKTDLSITGKPAQFGRGVIQDVSDKLLQQFIDCLESKVGAPAPAAAPAEAAAEAAGAPPSPAAETAAAGAGVAGATVGGAAPGAPAEEKVPAAAGAAPGGATAPAGAHAGPRAGEARPGESAEALDLGATVLPILLKTYWRQLAGAVVVLLVLRWLVRRRRD
jgi:carbon monoxide dehydrogenase subunit G